MLFDNDFDEIFNEFEAFDSQFMKRVQAYMDEMLKKVRSGELKGTFETREIKEPGVSGFVIMGRFGSSKALEPFEPIKPLRRRLLPEGPVELSKADVREAREPLTDVFEEDDATKIYVELPGEEKKDIKLEVVSDGIEVKAKNFYKLIELPGLRVSKDALSICYKNGVLEITIPKKGQLRKEDAKKEN